MKPESSAAASGRRNRRRRGSEVIEFSFVMIPMLAYLFIIIDIGWAVFARSTLQYATREACRWAITDQTLGAAGQLADIKQVVKANSFGLLSDTSLVKVRFYDPTNLTTPLAVTVGASGPNSPGNVVEVAVEGFSLAPLLPLLRDKFAPLQFSSRSTDRMGGQPPGGLPNL